MSQETTFTLYASRRHLGLLIAGEIDFLAVRPEKCSPDDIVMQTLNHTIPDDVIEALTMAQQNCESPATSEMINLVIEKYTKKNYGG